MPYIPASQRDGQYPKAYHPPATAGQLNYQITMLCKQYLKEAGMSYCTLNTIVGALECAKQEWYRRVVVGYEDYKLQESGDVYQ